MRLLRAARTEATQEQERRTRQSIDSQTLPVRLDRIQFGGTQIYETPFGERAMDSLNGPLPGEVVLGTQVGQQGLAHTPPPLPVIAPPPEILWPLLTGSYGIPWTALAYHMEESDAVFGLPETFNLQTIYDTEYPQLDTDTGGIGLRMGNLNYYYDINNDQVPRIFPHTGTNDEKLTWLNEFALGQWRIDGYRSLVSPGYFGTDPSNLLMDQPDQREVYRNAHPGVLVNQAITTMGFQTLYFPVKLSLDDSARYYPFTSHPVLLEAAATPFTGYWFNLQSATEQSMLNAIPNFPLAVFNTANEFRIYGFAPNFGFPFRVNTDALTSWQYFSVKSVTDSQYKVRVKGFVSPYAWRRILSTPGSVVSGTVTLECRMQAYQATNPSNVVLDETVTKTVFVDPQQGASAFTAYPDNFLMEIYPLDFSLTTDEVYTFKATFDLDLASVSGNVTDGYPRQDVEFGQYLLIESVTSSGQETITEKFIDAQYLPPVP